MIEKNKRRIEKSCTLFISLLVLVLFIPLVSADKIIEVYNMRLNREVIVTFSLDSREREYEERIILTNIGEKTYDAYPVKILLDYNQAKILDQIKYYDHKYYKIFDRGEPKKELCPLGEERGFLGPCPADQLLFNESVPVGMSIGYVYSYKTKILFNLRHMSFL